MAKDYGPTIDHKATVNIEERNHRIEDGLRTGWFGNDTTEVMISMHAPTLLIKHEGVEYAFDTKQLLEKIDEIREGRKPIGIKRFIRDGNGESLEDLCPTTQQLLEVAGRRMDKACTHDVLGEVLFEGDDGKFYTGNLEFHISEAHPDYVKEILEEDDADTP